MKLSSTHRAKILKKLLDNNFQKRKAMLRNSLVELGNMVYEEQYDEGDRFAMQSLPHGWLPECEKIKAMLGGDVVQLPLGRLRRIPSDKKAYSDSSEIIYQCDSNQRLARVWFSVHAEQRAIDEEVGKLSREIDAVLFSVSTVAKLISTWPEIKAVVEEICQTRDIPSLPVPRVAHLNEALGLGQK